VNVVHLSLRRHGHRCYGSCTLLLVEMMRMDSKMRLRRARLLMLLAACTRVVQMNRIRLVAVLVHLGRVTGHPMTSWSHQVTQPKSFALRTYKHKPKKLFLITELTQPHHLFVLQQYQYPDF